MVRMGLVHLQRAQAAAALSRWHLPAGIAAGHTLVADDARTARPRILQHHELVLRLDPSAPPRLQLLRAIEPGSGS